MDNESYREMIAYEEKRRREHFVTDFVKKKEHEYWMQIKLEQKR